MRQSFLAALLGTMMLGSVGKASVVNAPASNLFQPGGITQFNVSGYENFLDTGGNVVQGTIMAGDILEGMINVSSSQTPAGGNMLTPGNFQLSGVFAGLVQSITPNVDSNGDSLFQLAPYAPFATQFGLPSGAMFALWEGPAGAFNPSAATYQAAMATATQGSLQEVDGIPSPGASLFWTLFGSPAISTSADASLLPQTFNYSGFPGTSNLRQFSLSMQANPQTDPNIAFQSSFSGQIQEAVVPESSSILIWAGLLAVSGVASAAIRPKWWRGFRLLLPAGR